MRATLFCAWANDLKGFLWWCNADQEELHFPPYGGTAGVFGTDASFGRGDSSSIRLDNVERGCAFCGVTDDSADFTLNFS